MKNKRFGKDQTGELVMAVMSDLVEVWSQWWEERDGAPPPAIDWHLFSTLCVSECLLCSASVSKSEHRALTITWTDSQPHLEHTNTGGTLKKSWTQTRRQSIYCCERSHLLQGAFHRRRVLLSFFFLSGGCRPPRIKQDFSSKTIWRWELELGVMSTNGQDRDPDIELFVKVRQFKLHPVFFFLKFYYSRVNTHHQNIPAEHHCVLWKAHVTQ